MERIGSNSVCDGLQNRSGGADVEFSDPGRLPSASRGNDNVHSGSGGFSNQLNGHLIVARGFEVEEFHSDAILEHFTVDALQGNGQPLILRGAVASEDQSPDIDAIYWITENEDGEDEYHNIDFNCFKEREPYVHRMVKTKAQSSEIACEIIVEAYERWSDLIWQFDPDNYDFDPVREHGTYGRQP